MTTIRGYIKLGLHLFTVLIFSYVTLAAAAELIIDGPDHEFNFNGKTIALVDMNRGDVIRVPPDTNTLQNALFPGVESLAILSPGIGNATRVTALDGSGKLRIECGIHPASPPLTAFN